MKFRFLAALSIATMLAVIPVEAQTAARAPGTAAKAKGSPVSRTPDGRPDLSGVWSFANLTPLERPAEFAGKATLTPQEAADYAKRFNERRNADRRDGGAQADVSRAYNDAWYDYGSNVSLQTSLIVDPPDGKLPPLTPEAEKRAAARAQMLQRLPNGPEDRPLWERCILGFNSGPPMMPSGYNNNVQIFQTKDYVALLNEMVHSSRIIPLDGRPHGATRLWLGDSRGRWEGDTLVVDTINFTNNGTGTIGLRIGTDENFQLTERFTPRDANTMTYEFTVNDPTVWTKPWTASVPMAKSNQPVYEYACHEGNYGMQGILAGARADEKAAAEAAKRAN